MGFVLILQFKRMTACVVFARHVLVFLVYVDLRQRAAALAPVVVTAIFDIAANARVESVLRHEMNFPFL